MFQDDTPVVTPRNPWTAVDNAGSLMSTQQTQAQPQAPSQQRNVPQALSPFSNVDPMFLNGGNSTNSNSHALGSLPQPMSAPKLNNPGVIGDRTMNRNNSVSGVNSNLYDMMLRNNVSGSIIGDPRISCSPPLSGLHSTPNSNGGSSLIGRSTCESSTQTDENSSAFDISVYLFYSVLVKSYFLASNWS